MRKYGAAERTARKWIAEGCPDENATAMRSWIAARRSRPAGTQAILNEQMRAKLAEAAKGIKETISAGGVGAPSAQKRLERYEKALSGVFEWAAKSGDPALLKAVSDVYFRCITHLLTYDLKVDRARRDSGELIPRSEAENHTKNLVMWICQSIRTSTNKLAPALVGLDAPGIQKLLEDQFLDDALTAVSVAASKPCPAALPRWFLDACMAPLKGPFAAPDAVVAERMRAIEQIHGALVASNVQERLTMLAKLQAEAAEQEACDIGRAQSTPPAAVIESPVAVHPDSDDSGEPSAWGGMSTPGI
jgi:hypothetical protein